LFLPHPHEPLPTAVKSSAAAAGPVQLAGAVTPRIPAADPVAASAAEPVLTGGAPAPATRGPAPAQLQQAAPAVQPALQPASTITSADGASANLRAWSSIGSAPTVSAAAAATPRLDFSEVAATVASLSTEPAADAKAEPAPATPPATTRTRRGAPVVAAARATPRASATPPRATPKPPANPSRIWVQLGYSENRDAFTHDLKRMRGAAPDLFRGRNPFVASAGNRHRLLVGPFETRTAAQAFVNGLKAKEISAVTWTSPAGTEVARLAAR